MAEISKVATDKQVGVATFLMDLLFATRKKRLITSAVFLIIAFLLHIKNNNIGNGSSLKTPKRKVLTGLLRPKKEVRAMLTNFSLKE